MVSRAVWKTWPEGLSRQKPRPKAEVFVVTEAREWSNPIIARSLIDFFPCFIHKNMGHFMVAREIALLLWTGC